MLPQVFSNSGLHNSGYVTRLLLLKDNPDDAVALEKTLSSSATRHFEFKRVQSEAEFIDAFETFLPNAIISDFQLSGFDALSALSFVMKYHPDVPLIIVSGAIGEEIAAECIIKGAKDYLMKKRIARLPFTLEAALTAAEEKARKKAAEDSEREAQDLLLQASESVSEIIFVTRLDQSEHFYICNSFDTIFGFSRSLLYTDPNAYLKNAIEEDRERTIAHLSSPQKYADLEFRIRRADGQVRWLESVVRPFKINSSKETRECRVVRDITERKRAHATAQREVLLEQREEFVATLTHDLKSPLQAADLLFDHLIDENIGPLNVDQLEAVVLLKDSNNRMVALIQTMLDVMHFEQNPEQLWLEKINMVELVTQCISGVQAIANKKRILITLDVASGVLEIEADRSAIYRVVQNLLDNAIKYCAIESAVYVSLSCEDKLKVSVRDNGIGISLKDQQYLFQKFSRSGEGSRSKCSNGLGLYLCRKIVEAHKGEIKCSSKEGEGAEFEFSLPLR